MPLNVAVSVAQSVQETSDGATRDGAAQVSHATTQGSTSATNKATSTATKTTPQDIGPRALTGKQGGVGVGEEERRQAAEIEREERGVELKHDLALASPDAFETSFTNYVRGYIGCLGSYVL